MDKYGLLKVLETDEEFEQWLKENGNKQWRPDDSVRMIFLMEEPTNEEI